MTPAADLGAEVTRSPLHLLTLERALASALAVLGAAVLVGGYTSGGFQQATALQIILGAVICVCSIVTVLTPTTKKAASRLEPSALRADPRIRWRPEYTLPAVFFTAAAGYVVIIALTNFLWGTMAYGTFHLWALFRFHIGKALVVAVIVAGSAHLVFIELLGVPFS
ncbi:tripartite tricarboxylate transporter TctB family protein [Mycolicibacterium farcinogenes]|uniref:tripartite tricarboxylate transporter TctB family protein n=1 Tax=Mycolicibacterium farcinogenes TaxID=1802 RepID=UPI001C8EADC4|nr:tripartite tricarboxylate transporter TctB family protein [Mycolicibacterium farcinogenes]QZH60913.1 tripartite tricarboxylate transporter TctB family protein [Mycolicibacterium farcinogenes]